MEIRKNNAEHLSQFMIELKALITKHGVHISGYGYGYESEYGCGYEIEEDILEFSNENCSIALSNYGSLNQDNIDEIIIELGR